MAKPWHLPDMTRSMIDRSGAFHRMKPPSGLVLAGSHQQKMIRILSSDAEPHYGQIYNRVWLCQ